LKDFFGEGGEVSSKEFLFADSGTSDHDISNFLKAQNKVLKAFPCK
jgi:hypothetical protein